MTQLVTHPEIIPVQHPIQYPLFDLYDYQKELKLQLYRAWAKPNIKRVLMFAPTGAGKTIIAGSVIKDAVTKNKRVWFLVHRTDLILQTQAKLRDIFGVESGIISADYPLNLEYNLQICSLQTLQNRDLSDYGHCDLLVLDECHNSSYLQAFLACMNYHTRDAHGVWDLSNLRLLGLSATPYRSKGKEGYCKYFQKVVKAPSDWDMVEAGELKYPRVFTFQAIDYGDLEDSNHDEFTASDMKLVCNQELNRVTVEKFLETCPDRQTAFFCGRIDQAKDLHQQLADAGIKTEIVISGTKNRSECFERLAKKEIQGLVSVGALNEGFDEPSINCVVIARPMKARWLIKQTIGRGLRKCEGLPDCLILDMGDSIGRVMESDPLKQFPIDLCPRSTRIPIFGKPKTRNHEFIKKTCPECNHEHIAILRICPNCGHVYERIEAELDFGEGLREWGEVLDPKNQDRVRYLRSQLKRAFSTKKNPNKIRYNFYKKYGVFPPDKWLFGAVFGCKNPGVNQVLYRAHLMEVLSTPIFRPRERDIELWMRREFHQDSSNSLYLSPDKSSDPFIMLGLNRGVIDRGEYSELERAYQAKIAQIEQEYESKCYDEPLYLTYLQCVTHAYESLKSEFNHPMPATKFMI